MLLSESASAQLTLVSTTGTPASPVFHYDITLTNTGTTPLGTFWFAWQPEQDFLPSAPSSESSPTGWGAALTGGNNSADGTAIQWVATSNPLMAGQSLGGFDFTTTDGPAALAGRSPSHPATDVLTSMVYGGGPFSDAGAIVAVAPAATPTSTTTAITASQSTVTAGNPVTFTATVAPATPGGTAPTGTVNFVEDGNTLGSSPLQANGTAQFVASGLPIGTDQITATYSGDASFATSASAPVTETVLTGASPTTTSLATSAASINRGASVIFTATVAAAAVGGPTPTGTVVFSQDGNVLGRVAVAGDGTAALSTSSLPGGSDTITAAYSGDATYAGSTSNAVSETVATPASLVATIAKSTLPASLVTGSAATGSATINVANSTGNTVTGKATVELFAITDGSIDASAIQLASTPRAINLKAGRSAPVVLPVRITPAMLPAGSYQLISRVIDPSAATSDSSPGPSLTVAPAFVSLSETVTKSTIPASAVAGAKSHARVTVRITNNGNVTTTGQTTTALFVSLSGSVDANATKIQSVTQPLRIRPGKFASVMLSVKLIPAVAPGAYTVIAQVTDPNGQVTSATAGLVNITSV